MLSARLLDSVSSVNSFDFAVAKSASVGDAFDVYLQLIDLSKNKASHGFYPEGLRYIPAAGSTVEVTVLSIDSARQFVRTATNPFATDTSIWKFSILATDPVAGTAGLRVRLTESGRVYTFTLNGALRLDGSMEIC